ncbi:MAG: hypothetical protein AB7F86_02920 [Bdellovibrionales bacterium]
MKFVVTSLVSLGLAMTATAEAQNSCQQLPANLEVEGASFTKDIRLRIERDCQFNLSLLEFGSQDIQMAIELEYDEWVKSNPDKKAEADKMFREIALKHRKQLQSQVPTVLSSIGSKNGRLCSNSDTAQECKPLTSGPVKVKEETVAFLEVTGDGATLWSVNDKGEKDTARTYINIKPSTAGTVTVETYKKSGKAGGQVSFFSGPCDNKSRQVASDKKVRSISMRNRGTRVASDCSALQKTTLDGKGLPAAKKIGRSN